MLQLHVLAGPGLRHRAEKRAELTEQLAAQHWAREQLPPLSGEEKEFALSNNWSWRLLNPPANFKASPSFPCGASLAVAATSEDLVAAGAAPGYDDARRLPRTPDERKALAIVEQVPC